MKKAKILILWTILVILIAAAAAGCPHRKATQTITMPAKMFKEIPEDVPEDAVVTVVTEYESTGVTKAEKIWVELPGGTLFEIGSTEGNAEVIKELTKALITATVGVAAAGGGV